MQVTIQVTMQVMMDFKFGSSSVSNARHVQRLKFTSIRTVPQVLFIRINQFRFLSVQLVVAIVALSPSASMGLTCMVEMKVLLKLESIRIMICSVFGESSLYAIPVPVRASHLNMTGRAWSVRRRRWKHFKRKARTSVWFDPAICELCIY